MRKFIVIFYVITMLILTSSFVLADTFICRCIKVYDGDTIEVKYEDEVMDLRLDGIDCPEESQDFHKEAKQLTSNMVLGKDILVEIISSDQYGRYVSRITSGYKDLSLELVKSGLAWHYKRYSSDENLASAENAAKAKKKGIWSMAAPIPPWDFRQKSFNQMMAPYPVSVDSPAEKPLVYITIHGECYHLETCESIQGDKKPITLEEAIKQGYRPCRVCNPPEK